MENQGDMHSAVDGLSTSVLNLFVIGTSVVPL